MPKHPFPWEKRCSKAPVASPGVLVVPGADVQEAPLPLQWTWLTPAGDLLMVPFPPESEEQVSPQG